VHEIHEDSNHLSLRKLVNSDEDGRDVSVTWVEIDGRHPTLRTDASTRVYYILDGDFNFIIDGEAEIVVGRGDSIVIYRSCTYEFTGTGNYLVINGPAFQEGDDRYLTDVENLSGG
jgi:mannose-6-phosphate isomerase-like protein (cupin superfamily)